MICTARFCKFRANGEDGLCGIHRRQRLRDEERWVRLREHEELRDRARALAKGLNDATLPGVFVARYDGSIGIGVDEAARVLSVLESSR